MKVFPMLFSIAIRNSFSVPYTWIAYALHLLRQRPNILFCDVSKRKLKTSVCLQFFFLFLPYIHVVDDLISAFNKYGQKWREKNMCILTKSNKICV